MGKYIMALDQGTTSSRCVIFDKNAQIVSLSQSEFPQYYPGDAMVEQNALEILKTQLDSAKKAMRQIDASYSDIAALGIANQRETAVIWNKNTGIPVYNAIVWQCRRTAEFCKRLIKEGWGKKIKNKCGLLADPYFSGTKIKWILDNVPNARKQAENGELLFGTIDSWLIWNLSGKKLHVTDYSNASRTMLYNIFELKWDREILQRLDIPECILPEVKPSSLIYGESDPSVFGGPVVISGVAGDQQAALFGQGCHIPGSVKNTYGTGCFLLMNTGETPVVSSKGLLTTIAWGIGGRVEYALEGSVFSAGSAVQWLRDEMKMIESAPESEYWANSVNDTNGIYFVPAFTGLGTPYWDAYARGAVLGLTRSSGKGHFIRAVLESLAYQTADLLEAMRSDSGISQKTLKADGGACSNDFLMQFQADIIGVPVQRPVCVESTALGAAYLAGLGAGYWKKDEISSKGSVAKIFEPQIGDPCRAELLNGWHRAVKRSLKWVEK
ncbi:MAG: glycerol kinase GlpK [Oscillospiraceae bacterium]|nr:glycerol kinase GlpK [Oscillospiraceae bacterium]